MERDPLRVLADLSDELISAEKAEGVYGVAFTKNGHEYMLDEKRTEKLRSELAKRPPKIGYGPGERNPEAIDIVI